jgi:hypothetical protein
MFPASKNFPVEETMDLTIPNFEDERFDNDEIEVLESEIYPSLEAFMNRNQKTEAMSPDDQLILKINTQIEMISEAKERLKFYLDELDIFMPKKH